VPGSIHTMTVGVFVFELLDDFLFLALGAVVYAYSWQWFSGRRRWDARLRDLLNGLVFGVLAILLMLQGIPAEGGILIDARNVPIALVALFDGWPVGLLAAGLAAGFRLAWGGPAATAGAIGLVGSAVAGALAHGWARRDGGIRLRHVLTLGLAVFLLVCGRFAVLGAPGIALLRQVGPSFFVVVVGGIALLGRLFHDVRERQRATELRAVALLAHAAAHEINNPLAVLVGTLELLGPRVPPGSPEAGLLARAEEATARIKDIVARMAHITRIEQMSDSPDARLPPVLDIRRSSEPG
jgi:signal transduction histidine kinase